MFKKDLDRLEGEREVRTYIKEVILQNHMILSHAYISIVL
jgi:hypothetical protein